MTTEVLPSVRLTCTEGGSSKEYNAKIEAQGGGFVVTYAYGRIGGTLQAGTKTPKPVARDRAQAVYDKIVNEKLAKGYVTAGGTVAGYVSPTGQRREEKAIAVMLCEPVDDPGAHLNDDAWVAQPKYDGIRLLLRYEDGVVSAQNRKGLTRLHPVEYEEPVRELARRLGTNDLVIDGESIGAVYVAFDLLRLDGNDTRGLACADRYELLAQGFSGTENNVIGCIGLTEHAVGTIAKRRLYRGLKEAEAEGIIFKRASAKYVGRRTYDCLKHKFWASNTVMVLARNDTGEALADLKTMGKVIDQKKLKSGKRSVQMGLLDDNGVYVNVGDMSIPVNWPVPEPGTLVESRYLYAFRESNTLFQPQYEGPRDDKDQPDTLSQLQYKMEG